MRLIVFALVLVGLSFGSRASVHGAVNSSCLCTNAEASVCSPCYLFDTATDTCSNSGGALCEGYDGYKQYNVTSCSEACNFFKGAPFFICQTQCDESPTAVELIGFSGSGLFFKVQLSWETASEIDTVGYYIWKRGEMDEEYEKLEASFTPSQGDPARGAEYVYEDLDVIRGASYSYKLEDIDASGVSTFHGPVEVELPPGFCGTMNSSGDVAAICLILSLAASFLWCLGRRR